MPNVPPHTVGAVGESALLARIAQRAPRPPNDEIWSGDDAAQLRLGDRTLVATDFVVEGTDFRPEWSSGADVGWKALAINVSDIAAMGGRPTHALVSVAMPPDLLLETFDSLLDGTLAGCDEWDIALVGGDLGENDRLFVSVTIVGAGGPRTVTRAGARPGDAICVTGSLGGSAAGLAALEAGLDSADDRWSAAIARHLRPLPRVEEGPAIVAAGATSMIDISDGFGRDLLRLLSASGAGCEVSSADLRVDPAAIAVADATGGDASTWAFAGGEDFELLFTCPEASLEDVSMRVPVTRIGTVTEGPRIVDDGVLEDREELGWDHLRTDRSR